LDGTQ
jgi:hypothetical protein